MKPWGQLNQYLSSFEARAGLKVNNKKCTCWPEGPLLVPFVPWGPSQGQHFID